MNEVKKLNYTAVEELLMNEEFVAWYRQTNKTEDEKWNKWIGASPEHERLADEAIRLLKLILLAKEKDEVAEDRMRAVFNRIINNCNL